MGTYQDSVRELRGKEERKVANNTYMVRLADDAVALKLHNTYIITWYDDGSICLNAQGWHTATTKDRIDRWLPSGLRVATDTDGAWAVYRLRARFDSDRELMGYAFDGRRYFDGMRIDEYGTVLNPEARGGRWGDCYTERGW